jgi:hypothetical protein
MHFLRQILFLCITLVFLISPVSAEDPQEMMDQYRQMSAGTQANFPKELEILMPKGFSISSKGFIWHETSDMFLYTALSGTRKNDIYPKFGHDTEVEIGIMAYNPSSASYMAAQMPVIVNQAKEGFGKESVNNGEGWENGPIVAKKINGADVYIQKSTHKNTELDDHKYEDQIYYFVNAVMLKKNAYLTIRLIYYPGKEEKASAAIGEITKTFMAIDIGKYMK